MIISASRRTDIPAFYSEWFFNRLREGYCLVQNPMNKKQVRQVSLNANDVDAIVFWSKNPKPMLDKLHLLSDYPFYFQFTLNSYAEDIETNLPKKSVPLGNCKIIETFKRLSDMIGHERVIWRYDPILLNEKYTIQHHIDNFGLVARELKGYTEKVTVSFIALYSKIAKLARDLHIKEIIFDEKHEIIKNISVIAKENGFTMDTCAEALDLSEYGVTHAHCIDDRLIERITKQDGQLCCSSCYCKLNIAKDKTQRKACGCVTSVDIGAYNSCLNGCLYCYANNSKQTIVANCKKHNPASPLLIKE